MNSNRKNSPALTKGELRKGVKSVIAQIGTDERIRAALTVAERIESLPAFQSVRNIMLYSSLPDELPTDEMIRRWISKKNLFLPRVDGDEIFVLPYDERRLKAGAFGILEPMGEDAVSPDVLDLVIVPGRAFDPEGRRIGRGGGYYDRFFSRFAVDKRPFAVGVGFKCQLFGNLSPVTEAHDFRLDCVIVPEG